MKDSKFLKRDECGKGILLTIESCIKMNVAKEDDKPEMKWCLTFEEDVKPMVLNTTNAQLIAQFSGLDNSDEWAGARIVAYDDPNVSYGGKLVGGIRVRAPKVKPPAQKATPAAAPPAAAQEPADQDGAGDGADIPF
jgi:hypothetical protein